MKTESLTFKTKFTSSFLFLAIFLAPYSSVASLSQKKLVQELERYSRSCAQELRNIRVSINQEIDFREKERSKSSKQSEATETLGQFIRLNSRSMSRVAFQDELDQLESFIQREESQPQSRQKSSVYGLDQDLKSLNEFRFRIALENSVSLDFEDSELEPNFVATHSLKLLINKVERRASQLRNFQKNLSLILAYRSFMRKHLFSAEKIRRCLSDEQLSVLVKKHSSTDLGQYLADQDEKYLLALTRQEFQQIDGRSRSEFKPLSEEVLRFAMYMTDHESRSEQSCISHKSPMSPNSPHLSPYSGLLEAFSAISEEPLTTSR